jgi:hypothetical protein
MIDPLVFTAWVQNKGFSCHLWAKDDPEILAKGASIITVALIDQHWIPIVMTPLKGVLQVHTWDGMHASHAGLEEVVSCLAQALGFQNALVFREHRLFFTTELCGAMAIAFLRYALCGAQLPTDCTEATVIHCRLKESYKSELERCQIARRPWVWGAGDRSAPSAPQSDLHLAVNITREQRIDLINEKGFSMGDDEIRFHLLTLVANQHQNRSFPDDKRFLAMEPLIFNCWDSIGHIIASQWCVRNPQIRERGQNVVTAVAIEEHWLPVWMVPDGNTLQIHTFHADVDFRPFENILQTLAEQLGFQHHTIHRFPTGLPEHIMCGAHAMTFIAHVIMQAQLPETLAELRTLHTNMRASFVAHLYAIAYTPKPVVWGNGPPRESGPLPRMPEHIENQEHIDSMRTQRLAMIPTHSYAMGDGEIDFHVRHLLDCHVQGPRLAGPIRHFISVSPTILQEWRDGNPTHFKAWRDEFWRPDQLTQHFIAVVLIHQHWVPLWIAPVDDMAQCHTLGDFAQDDSEVDTVLRDLAVFLGFADVSIHRVPHGLEVSKLCGVMSICFLAHILLRTRWPSDVHELRSRCWDMKTVFAEAVQAAAPTLPKLWGWGIQGECGPLPRLPVDNIFRIATAIWNVLLDNRCQISLSMFDPMISGMTQHEMQFHLDLVQAKPWNVYAPMLVITDIAALKSCILDMHGSNLSLGGIALLHDMHWQPVIYCTVGHRGLVFVENGPIAHHLEELGCSIIRLPAFDTAACGVCTLRVLTCISGRPWKSSDLRTLVLQLKALFRENPLKVTPDAPKWGFGPHGALTKNLVQELLKHGVPENVAEDRAVAAIKTLGSEQVTTALHHRNPWKQLKALGNNMKFQFVMPSELAKVVEKNKGNAVGPKGKGKGVKSFPPPTELDPDKLQVLEGTFHSQGHNMAQLTMKQIGPVSSGIILMSLHDAEPYLRSGTVVSREPLALLVVQKAGAQIQTALPHAAITVPCRCAINNEPVLADMVMVQVGTGHIEKANGDSMVSVDTPDVVTLKIMVYKDELKGDWADFCGAPIRCLVTLLPKLKRCFTEHCTCQAWHNHEALPLRDPILDVWRRQFMRQGFKPCPTAQSEMFSVCIRIPICILEAMLAASGTSGAYCEPRTADGKEILAEYTVVWSSKHSLQEMQHLMQTNPAVTGLARLGDRRGLRVHSQQAKSIHKLLRPDSVFLPNGPKFTYTVGPFPYGVDRQAVAKILRQAGWECRPLQPTAPCPGRGTMWLIQATEDPENVIVSTTNGEIVITKQKQELQAPLKGPMTVGSADTLALCGTVSQAKQADGDPWTHHDPWRSYQPTGNAPASTGPTEGMIQIEERIQSAVLAKIQVPMEDDLPDRVQVLEGQVSQLLAKQQGLEGQFQEFSGQHTQQINALQNQVTAQAQQLHGHLENQNQTMQSLFEQQMQQIRGLLAKRPRDDGLE